MKHMSNMWYAPNCSKYYKSIIIKLHNCELSANQLNFYSLDTSLRKTKNEFCSNQKVYNKNICHSMNYINSSIQEKAD